MKPIELVALLCFLIACVWAIKRFWLDKRFIYSSQFVGENIFMQYQNEDKKRAQEHVIYMREDEEREDETGEDIL